MVTKPSKSSRTLQLLVDPNPDNTLARVAAHGHRYKSRIYRPLDEFRHATSEIPEPPPQVATPPMQRDKIPQMSWADSINPLTMKAFSALEQVIQEGRPLFIHKGYNDRGGVNKIAPLAAYVVGDSIFGAAVQQFHQSYPWAHHAARQAMEDLLCLRLRQLGAAPHDVTRMMETITNAAKNSVGMGR